MDGITLDIETGEFFAIGRASGCGKSTLLRLIAGLEEPDHGEIRLAGRVVNGNGLHMPPEERGVGFVFQSYALWPHLDVRRENVSFPAEAAGLRAPRLRPGLTCTSTPSRSESFAGAQAGGAVRRPSAKKRGTCPLSCAGSRPHHPDGRGPLANP